MLVDLPDVNVLIALLDPDHPDHAISAAWFRSFASSGWATCPLTENGTIRIMSSTGYSGIRLTPLAARNLLDQSISAHQNRHTFWPDGISLTDQSLFDLSKVQGHKQLTDIYLLGLCQRNNGRFVSLDKAVSSAAIINARSDLIHFLS